MDGCVKEDRVWSKGDHTKYYLYEVSAVQSFNFED